MEKLVKLNVGGRIFETYVSTLKTVPDSLLCSLGEHSSYYVPDRGEYFFDRNPDLFSPILDYYRSGELHFSHSICGSVIKKELVYWKIKEHCIASCCYNAFKEWDKEQETLKILDKTLAHSERRSYNARNISSFRQRLWRFLEKPNSSVAARVSNLINTLNLIQFQLCL